MNMFSEIITLDYLATTLLITLLPGTGVIYTLSTGLFYGRASSMAAVAGCTISIVPHLVASVFGLAALLHTSALLFGLIKYAGVAYLLYLAWGMWRDRSAIATPGMDGTPAGTRAGRLRTFAMRGILINLLNPKLSIFFFAFLPQFVPTGTPNAVMRMLELSGVFMAMTFVVFALYGLFAAAIRGQVMSRPAVLTWMRRSFAAAFVMLGAKLALTQR